MSDSTDAPPSTSDLILKRMDEIGMDRAEVSRRSGRSNVSKFRRKLDALLEGDLDHDASTVGDLASVLEIDAMTIRDALEADKERIRQHRHAEWRRNFVPHAVMWTERTKPTQPRESAMLGLDRILKLDVARHPRTFASQAIEALKASRWYRPELEDVVWLGKVHGVVVNYDPDRAEFFDMNGRSIEKRREAVGTHDATTTLKVHIGKNPSD